MLILPGYRLSDPSTRLHHPLYLLVPLPGCPFVFHRPLYLLVPLAGRPLTFIYSISRFRCSLSDSAYVPKSQSQARCAPAKIFDVCLMSPNSRSFVLPSNLDCLCPRYP